MKQLKKAALELLYAAGQGTIPCLFRTLTGFYCPGCGGTRALKALLHGKLWLSFCYHPLVLYLAVSFAGLLFYFVVCWKKNRTFSGKIIENVLLGGVLLLACNVIIKNSFLLMGKMDLLELLDALGCLP